MCDDVLKCGAAGPLSIRVQLPDSSRSIGATLVQVDPLSPRRVPEKELVPQRLGRDRVHRARVGNEINSPPLPAGLLGRLDFERRRTFWSGGFSAAVMRPVENRRSKQASQRADFPVEKMFRSFQLNALGCWAHNATAIGQEVKVVASAPSWR